MDVEKYSGLLYVARVFSSSAPVRAARPSFSEPITGDERFQVGDLRFAHAANEFFGGQDDAQDIFALVRIAVRAACEASIDRTRDEGDLPGRAAGADEGARMNEDGVSQLQARFFFHLAHGGIERRFSIGNAARHQIVSKRVVAGDERAGAKLVRKHDFVSDGIVS